MINVNIARQSPSNPMMTVIASQASYCLQKMAGESLDVRLYHLYERLNNAVIKLTSHTTEYSFKVGVEIMNAITLNSCIILGCFGDQWMLCCCRVEDAGTFTCYAENDAGNVSLDLKLIVQGELDTEKNLARRSVTVVSCL